MAQPVDVNAAAYDESKHTRGTGDQGGQFVSQGSMGEHSGSRPGDQTNQTGSTNPPPPKSGQKKTSGNRGRRRQTSTSKGNGAPKPAAPKRQTLKRGAANDPEQVKQLQALIRELKLANLPSDGTFGPATEAAVRDVQAKLGMKPTGRASPALMRRLEDAHKLSPCVAKAGSQVTAAYGGDAVEHTGAMIALLPTAADTERLAAESDESADELHCTLYYLGEAADFDDAARTRLIGLVADAVRDHPVVDAKGMAVSVFNPDGDDPCVVLGLSGEELVDVKAAVDGAVDEYGVADLPEQHEPWLPHVTLEYTDDPSTVVDYVDLVGPVSFDRVRVVFAGEATDLQLVGAAPVTAAAGHDITPGHDELHHWWVYGEGRGRWNTWTELRDQLVEHVGPIKAAVYASAWFHERYGYWSGSDLNRVKHGKPPRGKLVGPG